MSMNNPLKLGKLKSMHSKISLTRLSALAVCFVFIFLAFQFSIGIFPQNVDAQSSGTTPIIRLGGYAWSENIGWISFNDGNKPVIVAKNGDMNGFAWSEHVGWIQFGGLSGFPDTSRGGNAKLEDGIAKGWVRVVAGFDPVMKNGTTTLDNRGGWDGWIDLNNLKIPAAGTAPATFGTPCKNGCAWGSMVVGWIDFAGVQTNYKQASCTGPYNTVIPDGSNFTYYSKPDGDGYCASETRSCKNGVLSAGTLTELGCAQKNQCVRAGKTFENNAKGIFYTKSITAGRDETCVLIQAELTCKDGTFVDANDKADTIHKYLKCINNPNFMER